MLTSITGLAGSNNAIEFGNGRYWCRFMEKVSERRPVTGQARSRPSPPGARHSASFVNASVGLSKR
jgi:hypothetical protein